MSLLLFFCKQDVKTGLSRMLLQFYTTGQIGNESGLGKWSWQIREWHSRTWFVGNSTFETQNSGLANQDVFPANNNKVNTYSRSNVSVTVFIISHIIPHRHLHLHKGLSFVLSLSNYFLTPLCPR